MRTCIGCGEEFDGDDDEDFCQDCETRIDQLSDADFDDLMNYTEDEDDEENIH